METNVVLALVGVVGFILGVLITRYHYYHRGIDGYLIFFDHEGTEMPALQMNSDTYKRKNIIVIKRKYVKD